MNDEQLLREMGDACRRAGQCPTCGGKTNSDGLTAAVDVSPDAWAGSVPLNRLARYLFELDGGKWWASVEHVSQEERSRYFAQARSILTVGGPWPLDNEP